VLWRGSRPTPDSGAATAHGTSRPPPAGAAGAAPRSPAADATPPAEPLERRTEAARGPAGAGPSEGEPVSERARLIAAMESAGWVQAKAARLLGITPRQIGYALRKHQIDVKKF